MVAAAIAIAAVAALAVSAVYVNDRGDGNARAPSSTGPGTGRLAAFVIRKTPKPAPEIAFLTPEGEARGLADWRGKAVLFNLWATWCAPCLREMPALDRLQARLGSDDFEVVAVSIDRSGFAKPKAFYDKVGIEHLALYNDQTTRISSKLGVVGMPTTILFDGQGREIGRMAGPAEWDSDDAVELIKWALKAHS